MSDDLSGSVSILFQRFRAGDPAAVERIWNRFRPRLTALAEKSLAGRWKQMADGEDALQSAFLSFWQRAERGDFGDEMTRDDLWNVLGTIAVRKALRQQRHETARKRGGGRRRETIDFHEAASPPNSTEFDVVCAEMLELLEPDLRSYALLHLMGHKNREIADQFGCTERKVERKLQLIRGVWESEVVRWIE